MSEKTTYTVLSGESYSVEATSEEEALAKFFIAYGHASAEDYEGEGYDLENVEDDVSESETLTEVIYIKTNLVLALSVRVAYPSR